MPAFDDRSDRASIDTWYPSARRLAAWPHADGLVFISVERRDAADSVLIGFATDEEIGLRRRYRGHAPEAAPAATPPGSPTRAARLLGLDVRDLRRGPHGLNPLSERRRDRALRWLALLALIAFLAVFLGVLIVANRAAG
jgi:hypothetical protein